MNYFVDAGPTSSNNISGSSRKFNLHLNMSSPSSRGIIQTFPGGNGGMCNQHSFSSSSGADGIDVQIRKVAIGAVAPVLADIIQCFRYSYFPRKYKE